ncbi:hypothetical protein M5D96_001005 [Drosophila gunungcola]|uniref:Seminal fluid protein n=1 Tax=Drosophila gunungcola TaxID=103775 RepID=A0A9P9YXC0_9MUSC|nr:hypothetical protein M5D96_001005 [Drosophila gunungcola]
MLLRVLLVCLALFALAYSQPVSKDKDIFDIIDGARSGLARPVVPPEPNDVPQKRTLVFLLPILYPKRFYFT